MKRLVRMTAIVAVSFLLLSFAGPWLFLASWVPAHGKALLIRELEHSGEWTADIGVMRYDPLRGFILGDVRLTDRASGEPAAAVTAMRVRVSLLHLLLKRLAFQGRAVIERPVDTVVTFSGRYNLRDRSLTAEAATAEVPLASLTGPLKRRLPPQLSEGVAQLHVVIRKPAEGLPLFKVEAAGTHLVWTAPAWRLTGDATIEATLRPAAGGAPWQFEGAGHLRRATLEGVPVVASITQLSGSARFTNERIEIEELNGLALDSPMRAEGTIRLGPVPAIEALVESTVKLASLANGLQALKEWQPEGTAKARAVCRGPLHPTVRLDCLVEAVMDGVKLSGPKLPRPITRLGGMLRYDAVSRELSTPSLEGLVEQQRLSLSGSVALLKPVRLALRAAGTIPLIMGQPWLPDGTAAEGMDGSAAVDVAISGSVIRPRFSGQITFTDAAMAWTAPALRLDHLNGTLDLHEERIVIPRAAVHVNDQPLVVRGVITLLEEPRVTASISFAQGTLDVVGRITPEHFRLDEGRLALAGSRLTVKGLLHRRDGPDALSASGTVSMTDLTDLPFLTLPALKAWQVLGVANVTAQFNGRFNDPGRAALEGRLRSDRLDIRGVPIENVQATIEQEDRLTRIRVPAAQLADGKCSGELTLDHRGEGTKYFLRADLTGVQLATLAQAVPAWKSRTIIGAASSHLLLSGRWGERASWLGEGWFNASGERLGDVPLLDKLFRGLFGVLGDRLALDSLRRAQITQASFQWRLGQERVSSEDLRLSGLAGTEPVSVYAHGSVGLDKTLDLVIEPEFSEGLVMEAPTTSTLARTVLQAAGGLDRLRRLIGRHRLTGTLEKPQYRFEYGTQEIFKQIAPGSGLLENFLDAIRR